MYDSIPASGSFPGFSYLLRYSYCEDNCNVGGAPPGYSIDKSFGYVSDCRALAVFCLVYKPPGGFKSSPSDLVLLPISRHMSTFLGWR